MDHYEELGLSRSASAEEIRAAYRRLARLLHPDRCPDGEARRLADLQMKRLNGILEELTDPNARRIYDWQFRIAHGSVASSISSNQPRRFVWPAAAASLILIALMLGSRPAVVQVAPPSPVSRPVQVLRSRPDSASRNPRSSCRRSTGPRSRSDAEAAPAPPLLEGDPVPVLLEPVPGPLPFVLPVPDPPPPPRAANLTGEWFYVPPASVSSSVLYPPEFIELHLTEKAGLLAGHYRARYRVSDRAISPDVDFHFRGRLAPGRGTVPWKGPGGALGRLTLRRLDSGGLEVTWVADQLGGVLGLASGTATLVRKVE